MSGKKTVFVGLSGGVDSSVSAALLKEQGYSVVGAFIRVWQPDFLPCTQDQDRIDAMRVAAHLDIPFVEVDLEEVYKKEVVDYMVREYKAGRTPNPDVMCNKTVKFGAFFDYAMSAGADFVATGHYARVAHTKDSAHLLKAKDSAKDQSYFLWTLTQKQLQKTLFPIGEYQKSEVRVLAEKFDLHTATKKDSQGLCFVGKLDMKEFLEHFVPSRKGDVLNESGNVIGSHAGAHFYTLGQRHGLTFTEKGSDNVPQYVIDKDIARNTITVSPRVYVEETSGRTRVALENQNWIDGTPVQDVKYHAALRYHGTLVPVTIKDRTVLFETPLILAEGQSLVVYNDEVCMGGGVISYAE
jgi:tRNA-specific 2-thiouridylase